MVIESNSASDQVDLSKKTFKSSEPQYLKEKDVLMLTGLVLEIDLEFFRLYGVALTKSSGPEDITSIRNIIRDAKILRQQAEEKGMVAIASQLDQKLTYYGQLMERFEPEIITQYQPEEYLDALINEGMLQDNEFGHCMDNIRNCDQIPGIVQSQIDTLNQFKVVPAQSGDPRIKEAWHLMHDLKKIAVGKKELKSTKAYLNLVGSLIYGDMKNADIDLTFVLCETPSDLSESDKINDTVDLWKEHIMPRWPYGSLNSKVSISRVEIPKTIIAMQKISAGTMPLSDIADFYVDAENIATIFTGEQIVKFSKSHLLRTQRLITDNLSAHPFFGAMVIRGLENTIEIRNTRRNQR